MRILLIFAVFIVVAANKDKKEDEFSCKNTDSEVNSAGECKNHYYICDGKRKKVVAHCPKGLVFHKNQCNHREETPGCPEYKSDLDLLRSKNKTIRDSICKRRVDGHYNFPCENTHYSCKNGAVTWHNCPDGLIYFHYHCMEDKCIKKEHLSDCWPWYVGFKGDDPRCVNATSVPRVKSQMANPKKGFCEYKYDGHHSAGRCLNHFHICIYFKRVTGYCPEGMVFWKWRCHFKRDVKQCPEYKTDLELLHSKNETERNSICEIRGDGPYEFPCENEIYYCKNGKPIWKKCPDGEAFDFMEICEKKIHHSECPEFEDLEIKESETEFRIFR